MKVFNSNIKNKRVKCTLNIEQDEYIWVFRNQSSKFIFAKEKVKQHGSSMVTLTQKEDNLCDTKVTAQIVDLQDEWTKDKTARRKQLDYRTCKELLTNHFTFHYADQQSLCFMFSFPFDRRAKYQSNFVEIVQVPSKPLLPP